MSSHSFVGTSFLKSARIALSTAPALPPSSITFLAAVRASPRFGGLADSHSRQACPYVTTAGKGWVTSLAIQAGRSSHVNAPAKGGRSPFGFSHCPFAGLPASHTLYRQF